MAIEGQAHQPDESGDAVLDVHHVIALCQLGQEGLTVDPPPRESAPLLGEAEYLRIGEEGEVVRVDGQTPAAGQRALDDGQRARLDKRHDLTAGCRHDVLLVEQVRKSRSLLGDDDEALALAQACQGIADDRAQAAAVGGGRQEGRTQGAIAFAAGPAGQVDALPAVLQMGRHLPPGEMGQG